jgi:uncharacterized protein (DUF302 family)
MITGGNMCLLVSSGKYFTYSDDIDLAEVEMRDIAFRLASWFIILLCSSIVAGCGDPDPITPDRYESSDHLISVLEANVSESDQLEKIVTIDHSRLGAEAGSAMPPAKVLILSNPILESQLVRINPLAAIDLPLRVLAYESETDNSTKIAFNSFEYISSRYGLRDTQTLKSMFDDTMSTVLQGVEQVQIQHFEDDTMQPDGIVTFDSPFDFETTVQRLVAAIDSQDDTVWFGRVDFQERAMDNGIELPPALLLLFGAPAPGAKAMAEAPTLGLDAFCQKLLVWEDREGIVRVSFNDLLAIAERHGVPKTVALRVVNRRLKSTFSGALE